MIAIRIGNWNDDKFNLTQKKNNLQKNIPYLNVECLIPTTQNLITDLWIWMSPSRILATAMHGILPHRLEDWRSILLCTCTLAHWSTLLCESNHNYYWYLQLVGGYSCFLISSYVHVEGIGNRLWAFSLPALTYQWCEQPWYLCGDGSCQWSD